MDHGDRLTRSLKLASCPVGIQFRNELSEPTMKQAEPAPAGCSFWERGAEQVFVTTTSDHERCAIGVHTHTLTERSDGFDEELTSVLKVMADMEYATESDVAAIPVMPKSYKHVIYGPVDELDGDIDVVMLFVDARQSLVVAEAVQQVEERLAPAMGRPACAVIPQVVQTGKAAVSLGCCGARAYLDVLTDDVALWALPGARLADYAARIDKLAEANNVLGRFHELRRKAVESGRSPTYAESMKELEG